MSANPDLIRGCKVWDRLTEELFDTYGTQLYARVDYEPLDCAIVDDEAEVTVGSSPGHKTHIDLKKGRVEYYDKDDSVNRVMERLFEEIAGLNCTVREEEGVFCEGLTPDKVEDTFKVLAAPTTMDIRIERCVEWTDKSEEECMEREFKFWKEKLARKVIT